MATDLIVAAPDTYGAERRYAVGVVIGDWLGLSYELEPGPSGTVTIRRPGAPGVVRLPDVLFATPADEWLTPRSLPDLPLRVAASGINGPLPILFGRSNGRSGNRDASPGSPATPAEGQVDVPVDIFGSAFFLLTRYEELVIQDRDLHGRFPAASSILAKAGVLARPLLDEYVAGLADALREAWPALSLAPGRMQLQPGHDVDQPWAVYKQPASAVARAIVGDLVRRREPRTAIGRVRAIGPAARGSVDGDPYDTFDFLMDVSEQSGLTSTFHFVARAGTGPFDVCYDLEDPPIRALLSRIARRGHAIGLHGDYESFRSGEALAHQLTRLRDTCRTLGIEQPTWGSRQHYLRFENPATWRALDAAGLDWDATVGFADRIGFRSGTSREHAVFDVLARRELRIRSRPLVAMDTTLSEYMGVGSGLEAGAVSPLVDAARPHGGRPVILWHNNALTGAVQRKHYRKLIAAAASGDGVAPNVPVHFDP